MLPATSSGLTNGERIGKPKATINPINLSATSIGSKPI